MGARYGQKQKLTYKTAAKLRDALAALDLLPRRSDGRLHDTGLIRPYRPKPADFRETYVSMGWDGIEDHYCTNWRVIRRWIEEEGKAELIAARAAYVEAQREERRSKRRRIAA